MSCSVVQYGRQRVGAHRAAGQRTHAARVEGALPRPPRSPSMARRSCPVATSANRCEGRGRPSATRVVPPTRARVTYRISPVHPRAGGEPPNLPLDAPRLKVYPRAGGGTHLPKRSARAAVFGRILREGHRRHGPHRAAQHTGSNRPYKARSRPSSGALFVFHGFIADMLRAPLDTSGTIDRTWDP